jgi:hypothetical protein
MISDLEMYRTANLLIERCDADALIGAAMFPRVVAVSSLAGEPREDPAGAALAFLGTPSTVGSILDVKASLDLPSGQPLNSSAIKARGSPCAQARSRPPSSARLRAGTTRHRTWERNDVAVGLARRQSDHGWWRRFNEAHARGSGLDWCRRPCSPKCVEYN